MRSAHSTRVPPAEARPVAFGFLVRLMATGLFVCAVAPSAASIGGEGKPNVVVILADDLGFGDVRCNNPERGKIATPRIDRLASEGMRFTDGHSSSGVCSPSRYALLTGRYHWRSRLQKGIVTYLERPLIDADRLTIAKLARQKGYRTACFGKWHLGWDYDLRDGERELFAPGRAVAPDVTDRHRQAWQRVYSQPIAGGPTTRGFDEYFGTDVPNWPPYCFIKNDHTVGIPSEFLPLPLLKNQQAGLQGPALPDWKLEQILPALGDQAVEFIHRQAKAKQPFLVYMPLTSPHTPISPGDAWRGKSGMGLFADFVMETDAVVGRVLDGLRDAGVAEQTLVLFTADNGCATFAAAAVEKHGHYSSGPLREWKGSVYEGGHRVPFIARWPGVVKPGSVCPQLVHQADVLATLAEIFAVPLPANAGEDSFSLLPLLKGSDQPTRAHAVSCGVNGVPGVRRGPWKLILAPDAVAKTDVQLYNLEHDLGETKNLALAEPKRVAELKALMETLITQGRSTPGASQKNDVPVLRYPAATATP